MTKIKIPNLNPEMIKLENIKPYKKNPKKHSKTQIKNIAESIEQFGFRWPIILKSKKEPLIIAGHGRYLAAKKLEIKELPVLYAEDLNEKQLKAFRIRDNKTGISEWEKGFLIEELHDLMEEKVDLTITGFEEQEIKELLDVSEEKEEELCKELEVKQERIIECPKCKTKINIKTKKESSNA